MLRVYPIVIVFLCDVFSIRAQQPAQSNHYHSTKPDTAIQWKKCFYSSSLCVEKEYRSYKNMPWYSYNPRDAGYGLAMQMYFGDEDKIAIGVPISICRARGGTSGFYQSGISYDRWSSNFIGASGIMVCRNFFWKRLSPWVRSLMLSSGILYQYGFFAEEVTNNSSGEVAYNNYYFNNVVARAEMTLAFPMGHLVNKNHSSVIALGTFVLKVGYDYSFIPARWQNPHEFGGSPVPAMYTGGFYVQLGIGVSSYRNKAIQ